MPQLSLQERVFLVKNYYKLPLNRQGNSNVTLLRTKFRRHWGKTAPSAYNIKSLVKKFELTGNTCNQNKGRSGRRKSSTDATNVTNVIALFRNRPTSSVRKAAPQIGISPMSVHRILRRERFFPYKTQVLFKLTEADFASRLIFCNRFLQLISTNDNVIPNLWFSDEAHFYLDGYTNKQNMRMWEQHQIAGNFRQKPLHPNFVTVWCAISYHGIIGPYFYEDGQGRHLSVTAVRYHAMLQDYFYPALLTFPDLDINLQWFQQDGSTSHTALLPRRWLLDHFPMRVISRFCDFPWPARSPDLTVCDFFLWGALKDAVFATPPPTSLQQLREKITFEVGKISTATIKKTFNNFLQRLHECVAGNGAHVRNKFHHSDAVHIR